jgi:hypothetical protein
LILDATIRFTTSADASTGGSAQHGGGDEKPLLKDFVASPVVAFGFERDRLPGLHHDSWLEVLEVLRRHIQRAASAALGGLDNRVELASSSSGAVYRREAATKGEWPEPGFSPVLRYFSFKASAERTKARGSTALPKSSLASDVGSIPSQASDCFYTLLYTV